MKALWLAWFAPFLCSAQELHITADLLSERTTRTMFGRLPSVYGAAAVGICNDTAVQQTVSTVRIAQQIHDADGPILLPTNVALVVISAAQGRSPASTALRIGVAAISLAAIAAGWSNLTPTIKGILTDSAIAGGQSLAVLSATIPTHTLMTLTQQALPDPLTLPSLVCTNGIVLVERSQAPAPAKVNFRMVLPDGRGVSK